MIEQERFRRGDPAYFEEVTREYGPRVLKVVRSFSTDPHHAEDLFQEVWMLAFAKRETFQGSGSFEAWLYRLAIHACIAEYRARKVRSTTAERFFEMGADDEWTWSPVDPESALALRERERRVHVALARLSDREREALVLRILEQKSPDETAEIMGVAKGTVRSLIRNAVQRLKDLMEDPSGENVSRYGSAY